MTNPRLGQAVQLHYRASVRPHLPHHGEDAAVVIAGRGKPRNHLVRLGDGRLVVVPCGNVRRSLAPDDAAVRIPPCPAPNSHLPEPPP